MLTKQIGDIGKKLVKRFQTRDPFMIAEGLGIYIEFLDNLGSLKGMYRVIEHNRFIFINSNLSEEKQRIVCAHELGHDQLHRNLAAKSALREFMLYDMSTKPEYEANIVAAAVLLDDDEVLDYIYNFGYTTLQIAQITNSDINLVALKIADLKCQGYNLRKQDYRSDFLK